MLVNILEKFAGSVETIPCVAPGTLYLMKDKTSEELDTLVALLQEQEYTLHDSHSEGKNRFAVLGGSDAVLTVSWVAHSGMIRLAEQPGKTLPAQEVGEMICTPMLTQIRLSYFTDDCGMAYILRLRDGRFICFDGGLGKYDDPRLLYDALVKQNVLPRIRIAAWFITHPHDDHIEGFAGLMREHGDEIELERLLFNWPRPDLTGRYSNMERFNAIVDTLRDKIATPHSGQRFVFPGVSMDVLYTCDDLYPKTFPNINDSSMVIRMTFEGRRILFTGDAQEMASEEICARYDADVLDSEFLQVPHHGYWGGSDKLFARVNPETVLWPCPDFWYQEIKEWDCNRFFKESKYIKQLIIGGQQQAELNMLEPVPLLEAYPQRHGLLMEEGFSHGSMVDLRWSCVKGGPTGYQDAKIAFDEDGCCLTAGDARSVVELMQPGMLRGIDRYHLTMTGCIVKKPAVLGIWPDHVRPALWTDEDIVPIIPDEKGEFIVEMDVDRKNESGLFLLLQAGSVKLHHVRVEE